MKREEFEELFSNIADASYLLSVMSKAALDNTSHMALEPMRASHYEMAYALNFVSYAVKQNADTLWDLLEETFPELPEEEEEPSAEREPKTPEKIMEMANQLNDEQRTELYGFALGLLQYNGAATRK